MNINDPIPNKVSCSIQAKNYWLYNDAPDEREEDLYSDSNSELNDYTRKFPPNPNELVPLTNTQRKIEFWFE